MQEGEMAIKCWIRWAMAVCVISFSFYGNAFCQSNQVALLLQQTPVDGGYVNPTAGVHQFGLYETLKLTAVPEPGYQFVHWLGDVANPETRDTIVYLDSPKIIIAVFERVQFDFLDRKQYLDWTPVGGLIGTVDDYVRQGYTGGGRRRPHKWRFPTRPDEVEEEEDFPVPEGEEDFPVPDGEEDFPVPEVPEPTTAALLILGVVLASARRRPKKGNFSQSS